jgi:MFS family permease
VAGFSEFKSGWKIILAATVGVGTNLTTMFSYTAGVFLPSLTKTFGWADSQVMLSLLIVFLGSSALGPYIGNVADRFGARRVVLTSVFALSCAWGLLALSNGSLVLYYFTIAVITILGSGTLPVTWTKSVIVHFNERRGLALGICLIGTGIFGALLKLYAFYFLSMFGWRMAYVFVGLFLLVITFPMAYIFYRDPARIANAEGNSPQAEAARQALPGLTLKQALRTPAFWLLSLSFFLLSLSLAGIAPNLERFMTNSGFEMASAVKIASWYGIGIVIGRLLTGWLLDRAWAPLVIFGMLLPCAASFLLLSQGVPSFWVCSLIVLIIGTSSGVEYDALAYLVSRYFGMRAYSAVYGSVFIGFAIGAGLGPFSFSKLLVLMHGYQMLLVTNAVIVVIGGAVLLVLGQYPKFGISGFSSSGRANASPLSTPTVE